MRRTGAFYSYGRSSAKGIVLVHRFRAAAAVAGLALLAGCQHSPLEVTRSVCPAVAVPNYTGDTTLFTGNDTAATDIDVVAAITNVRGICADSGPRLATNVSFDVVARRSTAAGARSVTFPIFASVVQGGNLLVSKQVGAVTVAFPAGQARATASGHAHAEVDRAATVLAPAIARKVNRQRKPGDLDAATDPLADPEVKAAVRAATFEVLVGFQLSDEALAYNAAK